VINLNVSAATRWGLNALILLGVSIALYLGRSVFIPLFLSVLLSAMLWPLVQWLNKSGLPLPGLRPQGSYPWLAPCLWRLRFPWGLASIASVGVMVVVVLLVATGFTLSVSKFVLDIGSPGKQEALYLRFRQKVVDMSPVAIQENDVYFNADPKNSEIYKSIQVFFSKDNEAFRALVIGYFWSTTDLFWQSILIMFVLLFLLIEGRMLTRHLVGIFGPSLAVRQRVGDALKDMANQIRSYLVWRTIINFVMAIFLGLLYSTLNLSQGWTWALLTAVLWYIPYIGPIVAGFPPVIDAFVSVDNPWVAVGILVFYTLFVVLEGYFIVPVVMGRSMELNATTVMLACLFWQLVWGVAGLFLAMPLMAAVKTICSHVPEWQPWSHLMGTKEETPPPEKAPAAAAEHFLEDTQILTGAELQAQLAAKTRERAAERERLL
jgi:predicted PurR-regulated permease PerM